MLTIKESVDRLMSLTGSGPAVDVPWDGKTNYVDFLGCEVKICKSADPERTYSATVATVRTGTEARQIWRYEVDGPFVMECRRIGLNVSVSAAIHRPTGLIYLNQEVGSPVYANHEITWQRAKALLEPNSATHKKHTMVDTLLGAPDDWSQDDPQPTWQEVLAAL